MCFTQIITKCGWRLLGGPATFFAVMVLLLFSLIGRAGLPGRDWWFAAPEDAGWTNKPYAQIQAAAERNDPAGQYYLGYVFFFGQGCTQDVNKAFVWILRSAEQGYAQ